jgi:mRNA interferase MazF
LKRGEIWTVAGGGDYADKPRPVVIIQDDRFDGTASVTVCAFTSDKTDVPLVRPVVDPTEGNSLQTASRLMADKITTVPRKRLGRRIGALEDEDMIRLNRAILIFLGLGGDAGRSSRVASRRKAPRRKGGGR